MSQPCFFAHHNATAESTPPDKRTIARSIRFPPSRLGPQPPTVQAAKRRLPPHKYLSQTRRLEAEKVFRPRGAAGDGTAARGPGARPRSPPETRPARSRAVPVSVVQDREEMTQQVDNVFRVAG